MTCNNVILAQPSASSNISYTIPQGDSARLNFTPDEISGLRLGDNGELIISFNDGGQLTITNFNELADGGSLLYLADGTLVDPSILTSSLQAPAAFTNVATSLDSLTGPTIITQPQANTTQEVSMVGGQKYICDFDPANAATVEIKDGKMVLTFADGSQVVINNYETAMSGELPAELTVADGTVVDTKQLLTQVTEVATPIEELLQVATVQEIPQQPSAEDVAQVSPAAGEIDLAQADDLAEALANIETAAGGDGGYAGNSGYGFNSTAVVVPFDSPDAIGPLGPTKLAYVAPEFKQETLITAPAPAAVVDSIPTITSAIEIVDETNLGVGPLIRNGQLIANYGNDTPGEIIPSGTIQYIVPFEAAFLTSHGNEITISNTVNGYTATANGATVFTFTINPQTGVYNYTQFLQIDHPDSSSPNDPVAINLGIIAKDADGDRTLTYLRITILDDGPVVLSQTATVVDETDFVNGSLIQTGQFYADMGEDIGGSYSGNNTFNATGSVANSVLSSNGVPVTVTFDAATNTYTGAANGVTVFTLTLDPITAAYTYTQLAPLSHADGSDPDDVINLEFGVTITDYDGDTASGIITVQVHDDAPVTGNDTNTIGETDLSGGAIVINDSLSVDFGADGQGTLAPSGTFTSTGSLANNVLSSNGFPVSITNTANGYVGTANGVTVFTLVINANTGAYTFTLLDNLDHADATNPNDVITLNFGTIITDYDGDSATGQITINIKDDAPIAHDDTDSVSNTQTTTSGNVLTNDNVGQDNSTVAVTTPGTYVGTFGTLIINVDGTYEYTRTGNQGGVDTFDYTMRDSEGDLSSAVLTITIADDLAPIDINGVGLTDDTHLATGPDVINGAINVNYQGEGAGATTGNNTFSSSGNQTAGALSSNGIPVIVSFNPANNTYTGVAGTTTVFTMVIHDNGTYTFSQIEQIDHSDTTNTNEALYLEFGVTATDADGDAGTGNVRITILDDAPVAHDDTASITNNQTATGNVLTNDEKGQDNGANVKVTTPGTFVGNFGTLVINANGSYTYTRSGNAGGVDNFTYTMQDNDGDTSSAALVITVKNDYSPIEISGVGLTDDTHLATGPDVINGPINVNYQGDGAGATTGNNTFSSSGNQTAGALSSNGVPVIVSFNPANNTYTGVAGVTTVFTMVINANNSYTFTQVEQLDHSDTSNTNEALYLNFGVTATDADGDSGTGNVRITVLDDAPVAHDDKLVINNAGNGTGNVLTNDSVGQDTSGKVIGIQFEGTNYNVPTVGNAVIQGNSGTLTIQSNGQYVYVPHANAGGSSESHIFSLTSTDVAGTQSSITRDGITIKSNNGNDLRWVNEGDGSGVGIAGAGTDKVYTSNESLQITFANPTDTATFTLADMGANNIGDSFAYKVYLADGSTVNKTITINGSMVVGGMIEFTVDGGIKEITRVDLIGGPSFLLNNVETSNFTSGEAEDHFIYTIKDGDGDTSSAKLDICVKAPDTTVDVNVNNNVDDICVKEDGCVDVPVTAHMTGGDGDEIMTLVLTGVNPSWGFTAPGWTKNVDGSYSITLPAGHTSYNGNFNFAPPANSDVDLTGLNVKATVFDPDFNSTKIDNDGFNIHVDAVADAPTLNVTLPTGSNDNPGRWTFSNYYNYKYWGESKSYDFIIKAAVTDTDGSEKLDYFIIEVPKVLDGFGVGFNKGTEISPGIWKIVAGTEAGLQITFPEIPKVNGEWWNNPNYMIPQGIHNFKVTAHSLEYNLSGQECDLTDNHATTMANVKVVIFSSPLVLDLNNDGLNLTDADHGVYFDINGDGVKDKTGWVAKEDGFLALDKDGNGNIDGQNELFGGVTEDGFTALGRYDSNHDGVINNQDDIWADLKVWQDLNQDGISQEGELRGLNDYGITAISLNAKSVDYEVAGNGVSAESTVSTTSGDDMLIGDAWFSFYNGADADQMADATSNELLYQAIDEASSTLVDLNNAEAIDITQVIDTGDDVTAAIQDFVYSTETADAPTFATNDNPQGSGAVDAVQTANLGELTDVSANAQGII